MNLNTVLLPTKATGGISDRQYCGRSISTPSFFFRDSMPNWKIKREEFKASSADHIFLVTYTGSYARNIDILVVWRFL